MSQLTEFRCFLVRCGITTMPADATLREALTIAEGGAVRMGGESQDRKDEPPAEPAPDA